MNSDELREAALAAYLRRCERRGATEIPETAVAAVGFRAGYDAGQASRDAEVAGLKDKLWNTQSHYAECERSLEEMQCEANAENSLFLAAEAHAEQMERELQSAAQEANDLNRTVERLTQELAAERERNDGYNFMCREAEEAKEAAESALAAERAELKRCREVIGTAVRQYKNNCRIYEIMQQLEQALSAAPPAEAQDHVADLTRKLAEAEQALKYTDAVRPLQMAAWERAYEAAHARAEDLTRKLDQAQRENATLGADNERAARELLEVRNAIRGHEKRSALYDQECGMCGASAEELVAFTEWSKTDNAKLGARLALAHQLIERAHKSMVPFAVSLCRDLADFLASAPSTECRS